MILSAKEVTENSDKSADDGVTSNGFPPAYSG